MVFLTAQKYVVGITTGNKAGKLAGLTATYKNQALFTAVLQESDRSATI